MSPEQLAALAGTNSYKGTHAGGGYYDTVTLGKDGKFYLAHYSQPKDNREDPTDLGKSFEMIIIKIRSKWTKWSNNNKVIETTEYDAGTETIHTTIGDLTEKELKARDAKKSIIVYGLVDDQITKLTVSGGSLYNPDDEENLRLYTYLQSFEGDDHIFMFNTKVSVVESPYTDKEGEEKVSYNMVFARGVENTKNKMKLVGESLTKLIEELKDNDARDLKFLGSAPKTPAPTVAGADENDEDAPF